VSAVDPEEPEELAEPTARPAKPVPAYAARAAETDLLATIGQRIGGRLLDTLILGLPLSVLTFAVSDVSDDRRTLDTPLWAPILATLIAALYEVVLIRMWGQTIGKRVVGIKVVRVTDGNLPDWTASFVRYLLPVIPILLPVPVVNVALSLVVYLVAVTHPLRRGWHDRAAGTLVIKAQSAPREPPAPGDDRDGDGDGES
jgi:uncharacterized RDD family membrane protein YckC